MHTAKIAEEEEKVPQVRPAEQKATQLIEEAQEALGELKKDTSVERDTEALREVYKKLAEICNKAVKTQKNMLEAEYTTDTSDSKAKVSDTEIISNEISSYSPKLSSVIEKTSPNSND